MLGHETIVLAGKAVESLIAKRFGASVIERWTRHRAVKFYEGFLQAFERETRDGQNPEAVERRLQDILADDKQTEVLFEAYRAVTFARSKTIGPRIIGLLTAAIVTEGRSASDEEESIFSAAEELSDADFQEFVASFDEHWVEAQGEKKGKKAFLESDGIVVPWSEETRDSAWPHSREAAIDTTPIDLAEALGLWASRLGQLGLMSSKVSHREQEYKEDSERHVDEDGVLSIYAFSITFQSPCKRLAALAKRALAMDAAKSA